MSSFFLPARKRTLIHVGGQGDSLFRAVAVGLMDNFLANASFCLELVNTVLRRHFNYYPMHCPEMMNGMSPNALMNSTLKKVPMVELVHTMAFTLRQLTVDEMVLHPVRYSTVFFKENETVLPTMLRRSETWIDCHSSVLALTSQINQPMDLQFVVSGKELREPPIYFPAKADDPALNFKIVIELDNQQSGACVIHPEHFNRLTHQVDLNVQPQIESIKESRSMPEIISLISAEQKRVDSLFATTHSCLMSMVKAGELTKENCVDLYIQCMGAWGSSPGSRVFSELDRRSSEHTHSCLYTHDEELVLELVHTLAKAVSIGKVSENALFELIEKQESASRTNRFF